jgi:hypothetical protein
VDQARDFLARENLRQALGHFGHGDVEANLGPAQHGAEHEPERAGRLIDARVGELLLGDEMQEVALQLLGAERVGGAAEMLGQCDHCRAVGFLRSWREAAQQHRVNHPPA